MAHTYVFQKITYPQNFTNPTSNEGQVQVVGTVDGIPVIAYCWYTDYLAHAGSVISAQTFLANVMLAAVPGQSAVPQNAPPPGTTITI